MGRSLHDRNGRGRAIGDRTNGETNAGEFLPQGFDCGEVPIDNQNLPLAFGCVHGSMQLKA